MATPNTSMTALSGGDGTTAMEASINQELIETLDRYAGDESVDKSPEEIEGQQEGDLEQDASTRVDSETKEEEQEQSAEADDGKSSSKQQSTTTAAAEVMCS